MTVSTEWMYTDRVYVSLDIPRIYTALHKICTWNFFKYGIASNNDFKYNSS